MVCYIDTQGNVTEKVSPKRIKLIWGYAFGETYCGKVYLECDDISATLFDDDIVKIDVGYRFNSVIKKGEVEQFVDRVHTVYLPPRFADGKFSLLVNDTTATNLISKDTWLMNNNKRSQRRSFPTSVILQFNGQEYRYDLQQSPMSLSEKLWPEWNKNEKLEVVINF